MKKIISLLLCAAMITISATGALAATAGFTDVPAGTYYTEAVEYTTNAGLFKGITETTFAPFTEVSRAMFVTVLGRYYGIEEDRSVKTEFTDVSEGSYYIGYVKWASDAGIVNGIGGGLFAPNSSITRQDMCVILRRFCNYAGIELTETVPPIDFDDEADIRSYAKEAVAALQRAGIVNGVGTDFNPTGTSNRAQAATVLMRIAKLAEAQKDTLRLTDPVTGVSVEYTLGCGISSATRLVVSLDTQSFHNELSDPKSYTLHFIEADAEIFPRSKVTVKLPVGEGADARNRTVYELSEDMVLNKADCTIENGYYVITTDCKSTIVTGVLSWTENY